MNDCMKESGKIYRNSVGMFYYVCIHCGNYFEDIYDTLNHIENHFSDGTIENEKILENCQQPMETTKLFEITKICSDSSEFISIAKDDLKTDPLETNDDASTDCIEPKPIETTVETRKILTKHPENDKKTINCPELFTHQIHLTTHTKAYHLNEVENIFKCEKCFLEFSTNVQLNNHLTKDHTSQVTIDLKVVDAPGYQMEDSLECKVCRRRFKAKHLLKRHLQRSTYKDEFCFPIQVGEFPFYCDICGLGFPHKFRLNHHMNQRHIGKETRCKYCCQKYVLETCLRKHEKKDCPQRPDADEGGIKRVFRKRQILSDGENPGGSVPPVKKKVRNMLHCEFCDKIYTKRYLLKEHLLSHPNSKEFKCDQCDRAYNTKSALQEHYISNHTQKSTFDCDICGWKFREKQGLKTHMRRHSGDYRAHCQICNKNFTINSQFKYHMITVHSNETPHQCDLCGKSFKLKARMNEHRRRHTNQNLPCDNSGCDKIFSNRYRLLVHQKTHTDERNIVCKVCGKNFKTALVLKQHMYLHKEKRFMCKFCPMTFAQPSGRRGHEKLRHHIV